MQDAGAICCDGVESCTRGEFGMMAGECQNDICCSGNRSCEDSAFFSRTSVRSQRCDGIDACKGGASSWLSGDLTCNGMASCEDRTVTFGSEVNVTPTHAITCTGENACRCDAIDPSDCVFLIFDLFGAAWCQDHGNCAISVFQGDLWIWLWVKTLYPL